MITPMLIDLALIGFLTWVIVTYVPMPQQISSLIVILVVLFVVLKYVLPMFGARLM